MENFILTKHYQYNKRGNDGRSRSYLHYFLNGKPILKQKIPYDERYERGFDKNTAIYDEFILNSRLHQTRTADVHCGANSYGKTRQVSFPISKKRLAELNVPSNQKIEIS